VLKISLNLINKSKLTISDQTRCSNPAGVLFCQIPNQKLPNNESTVKLCNSHSVVWFFVSFNGGTLLFSCLRFSEA